MVANLTLGAGGGAAGVQTFVVTNSLNVNSLPLVTGGGVLNVSSSGLATGPLNNSWTINLANGMITSRFGPVPLPQNRRSFERGLLDRAAVLGGS